MSDALGALASALVHRGEIAASLPHFTAGIELARELGDVRQTAFLLGYHGVVTGHQGDFAGARLLLAESDALLRTLGDTRSFEGAILLFFQGWLALLEGNSTCAARLLERSMSLARDLDAKSVLSGALAGLGEVALGNANVEVERAIACFRDGLALGQEGNYPPGMVLNLQGFVRAAARKGELVHVARLTGAIECLGRGAILILPPCAVVEFASAIEKARKLLGEDIFETERASGHKAVVGGAVEWLVTELGRQQQCH
jgi:hypothetical protein